MASSTPLPQVLSAVVLGATVGVVLATLSATPATLNLQGVTSVNVKPQASFVAATPILPNTANFVQDGAMRAPKHTGIEIDSNANREVTPNSLGMWFAAVPTMLVGAAAAVYYAVTSPSPTDKNMEIVPLMSIHATSESPFQNARDRWVLAMQEAAARAKIEAEKCSLFNCFAEMNPTKAFANLGLAAVPFVVPAAAMANSGALPTEVTPDLYAGVAAGVSLVAFGQYLYSKDGGHGHGPPEPEHPLDPVSQPFPEGEDGEALKAVFTEPYDIWRQSLLRYLGYSNELGEAFRPLVGDFLANSTYAIAIAYVLADSIDKAGRASERGREMAAAHVFMQMDEGLRGKLQDQDLLDTLKDVKAPLSAAEVEEFLKRADVRNDKGIDFDEFYLALKRNDPALIQFLEAGAANLPEDQARPWRRALSDGVNMGEVRSVVAGLDAMLWQLTASVAMPGFTINRIVALTGALCYGWKASLAATLDPALLDIFTYLPTIVGLLSITVIVHPLDTLADELFNVTLRKYVFKKLPMNQTGQLTEDMVIKKLKSRGDPNPPSSDWIRKLIQNVDTDKDGYVSLTEWRRNGLGEYDRYIEEAKRRTLSAAPVASSGVAAAQARPAVAAAATSSEDDILGYWQDGRWVPMNENK